MHTASEFAESGFELRQFDFRIHAHNCYAIPSGPPLEDSLKAGFGWSGQGSPVGKTVVKSWGQAYTRQVGNRDRGRELGCMEKSKNLLVPAKSADIMYPFHRKFLSLGLVFSVSERVLGKTEHALILGRWKG